MKMVIQFALLAFLSVLQHGQMICDGNNSKLFLFILWLLNLLRDNYNTPFFPLQLLQ